MKNAKSAAAVAVTPEDVTVIGDAAEALTSELMTRGSDVLRPEKHAVCIVHVLLLFTVKA